MSDLGKGVYTLPDAARLVRGDANKIRRWLYGYDYAKGTGDDRRRYHSSPLWDPQYGANELGGRIVGFRDLMELRIVREFVTRGVPLIVVRYCLAAARDMFGGDYPLTRQRFLTDGETVFHEALDVAATTEDGPALLDLRKRQHVFRTIVKDSLYAGIEYDGDVARRWYPEGKRHAVVVDPEVQFGQPAIEQSGVPTAALYAAWLAEGKKRATVAKLYEVDPRHVDAAVRFEEKLRRAA
jgi:uncharacterized protein (DUF433 family)